MEGGWIFAVLAAVLVGLLAWVRGQRQDRTRADARKQEQSRARIAAAMIPRSLGGPTLVVRNAGPGDARDLEVRVDGEPPGDHPCFHRVKPDEGMLAADGSRE